MSHIVTGISHRQISPLARVLRYLAGILMARQTNVRRHCQVFTYVSFHQLTLWFCFAEAG
jgi:hypothetical protein